MKKLIIVVLFLLANTQTWSQTQLINLGATIPGESLYQGYSNFIEIFDVAFNTNYQNQAKPGLLSFKKMISKSSPKFMKAFYETQNIGTIEVVILKQGGNGLQKYCAYKLKDCVVSSIKNIDENIEQIEILPSQFYIEYRQQLDTGLYGPYLSYGWNYNSNSSWDGM